jgi:hypothetical protein
MPEISPKERVLRISTTGKEPIILQFEGVEPVTVRLEIDSKCTCHAEDASANRPGSYTYRDPRTPA